MNCSDVPTMFTDFVSAGRARAGRGVEAEHQRATYYDYV